MGDWKTRNAGTTRISWNSIIFANLVTCSPFGSLRYNNLIIYSLTTYIPAMRIQ